MLGDIFYVRTPIPDLVIHQIKMAVDRYMRGISQKFGHLVGLG